MMEEKRFWELFHENGDKEPEDPPKEKPIYLDLFQKTDMIIIFLSIMAESMGIDKRKLYSRALDMVVKERNER